MKTEDKAKKNKVLVFEVIGGQIKENWTIKDKGFDVYQIQEQDWDSKAMWGKCKQDILWLYSAESSKITTLVARKILALL